jgi:tetratricopeptide (TPR) repeat protein/tRNA A-37 threonylcarbamoyl transferase component Bud32
MEGEDTPQQKRQRRLRAVRTEIARELQEGNAFSPGELRERYPDLEPELGNMLAEIVTQVGIKPSGDIAGAETVAGSSRSSPDADSDATVARSASSIPPSPGGSNPTIADATVARETMTSVAGDAPTAPDASQQPGRSAGLRVRYIGDYETIAVLGQGGMGVVYKARQITLNRLVALKMIRNAEFANDDQVRRFQNEAEAVATLDHPGIVPIYEVGTYEDQRYFSMKLIEGDGLEKKLGDLSKDPRAAARVVAEVADAVNHAHQRGILHRDLKPANILLDNQGHAHVTDFGLAKRIEADAGLTVSGAIMGTPSYMAPEQAAGQTSLVTTASDVYGLGAILYAVLTGRAPFASDSVMNTLDQVRNRPPQPPARLNARVPADLELICLKCLEKEPQHRYVGAQALRDDLNRWLHGEPIAARPVGPMQRLRMWAKRKPALAGVSAALIVAMIAGMVGVTWQWREAVSQRNQAREARDDAVRQEQAARAAEAAAAAARDRALASEDKAVAARAQAEQNAQIAGIQATLALNTIQDLITRVRTGLEAPGLYELKAALLDSALKRIDSVAGVYEKSTSKEATTAAALMELGKIYRQLGQTEKAFKAYQQLLTITKERVKIKKFSDPSRQNLANTYLELALCSEELNRDMNAALNYNRDAVKLYEDIDKKPKLDDFPIDRKIVRAGLAEAYTRVGVTQYRIGELRAALENYRKAYNLRRTLADENKDSPRFKQDLSYSMMALAETSFRLGDRAAAEDFYSQVLDQREAMVRLKPNDLAALKELGDVYYMIGEFRFRTGDLTAARRNLEKSRDWRKDLVGREPRNVLYSRDLGVALYRLGNLADVEKKPSEAKRMYEASLTIREELARISENNDRRQTELMLALAHTGQTARASELADRFSSGPNLDREQRIYLAACYAQVARSTPPEKAEQVQTALVKSVESVRLAVRDGFQDRVYLETEPDLEPIRNRDDFKQIVGMIRPG